jgi:hypothetical protein
MEFFKICLKCHTALINMCATEKVVCVPPGNYSAYLDDACTLCGRKCRTWQLFRLSDHPEGRHLDFLLDMYWGSKRRHEYGFI